MELGGLRLRREANHDVTAFEFVCLSHLKFRFAPRPRKDSAPQQAPVVFGFHAWIQ